ncbi:AAA domain-containing protein [Herbiconiux sp. P17]|uniref:AAA domain-containing protein n=1 Tax=Herbiconiux wuyangfengii TaxID=3342794 RepID=UPI0035B98C22
MSSSLESASREWRNGLIDVGGSNRLLYYRDTSTTIDLGAAPVAARTRLLHGDTVRLAELFPAADARQKAQKACASLYKKQQEATEEYGVSIAYLAAGMCSWNPEDSPALAETTAAATTSVAADEQVGDAGDMGAADAGGADAATPSISTRAGKPTLTRPRAPVLLRTLELTRRRGLQESWELRLIDEFQFNGVLLHVVNADRERIDDDAVLDLDTGDLAGLSAMLRAVERSGADVDEFRVDDSLVLGAFTYTKQPMVDDVSELDALGASDIVSALAGDLDAAERVRAITDDVTEALPDHQPVDAEYLVLDADASQSYVVNAALAGRNLVVEGPPGTGKSQTIANIIATSVAAGRSVLFVAQKRAAVSAVLDRLAGVDLSHLVLDLFAASSSRRFVAEQLQTALDRQASAGEARVGELHYSLGRARDLLVRHKDAMHEPSRGWGVSVAEMIALSIATPLDVQSAARVATAEMARWDAIEPTRIRADLEALARIGALDSTWWSTPGWSPNVLSSDDALRHYGELLDRLTAGLPQLENARRHLASTIDAGAPDSWQNVDALAALFTEADRLRALAPGVLDPQVPTAELRAALLAISRAFRTKTGERISGAAKRDAKRLAKRLVGHLPRRDRATVLVEALALRQQWPAPPLYAAPQGWRDASAMLQSYRADLTQLDQALQGLQLALAPLSTLTAALQQLAADPRRRVMPTAHAQKTRLTALGLGGLVADLEARPDVSQTDPVRASTVFDRVASASVLDDALLFDPDLATVSGADLDAAATSFQKNDLSHLTANAVRIRRAAAERLKDVLDAHPDQHLQLKKEATRKTRFTPVRRLMHDLPDVMLAAKPVWAMSPLQVSRLLPLEAVFDLVIFDEASQVKPADAIPAILRGRQLIVAGDSRQLPPTEFFSKTLDDADDASDSSDEDASLDAAVDAPPAPRRMGSLTRDAESILFAMDRLLAGQSRRLLWHYRSRDERLIAVSNAEIYDRSLTTFPAADTPDAVSHIAVPTSAGINGGTNSPDAEVAAVVAAVKAHAQAHPDETLGVIAFGIKHQNRLEAALGAAFDDDPALEAALNARPGEPFFVKAVERVQGDERDAIILTVGYGKSADDRLRLFWGPLLQPGGERRLNVAISRARLRMSLITSFGPDDMAADAHASSGYQLMYHFLRFMASGGSELGGGSSRGVPLNAFEIDVRDRLTAAGLRLDPQVGVGSYRIDFAARHPSLPGRHVLAIEADGASYHSGHIARERDRLRQQLLERRGWVFHRIWSTDWFNDADGQVAAVLRAFDTAVARVGATPSPDATVAVAVAVDVPVAWELPVGARSGPRPQLAPAESIDDYSNADLRAVIEWIRSDDVIRSADDELAMAVTELGFARRGQKIVRRLREAQWSADLD